MVRVLVSSCLLGDNCKYNGKNNYLDLHLDNYEIHKFCPEVSGGLSIPRVPCEIINNKVISKMGIDCTKEFNKGAILCLEYCLKYDIKIVILKEKSPSCGKNFIYDGTFSSNLINGSGVTTKLLLENGIKVFNEDEWRDFIVSEVQS